MDHVDLMSDAELRAGLLKHGYSIPITAGNRNILKKKLKDLLTKSNNTVLQYKVETEDEVERNERRRIERDLKYSKVAEKVSLISDEELCAGLLKHGYNIPITTSNRSIFRKKLTNLLLDDRPDEWKTVNRKPIVPVKPMQRLRRTSTDLISASLVPSLTDAQLRARLSQYGYRNIPITATTRTALQKKLMSLLSNETINTKPNKPVNNKGIKDMWSLTEPCTSSDNDVDDDRTTSSLYNFSDDFLRIPNNSTYLSQSLSDLNEPSTSTGKGVRPSDTTRGFNFMQSPFCQSLLDGDGDMAGTSSSYSITGLSMDTTTTARNNTEEGPTSHTTRFIHPTKNISSKRINSTDRLSDQNMNDMSIKDDSTIATTFMPKIKSPFIIDFMSRLSALTEEPPRPLSCDIERKRNCLTPLQQRVLQVHVR